MGVGGGGVTWALRPSGVSYPGGVVLSFTTSGAASLLAGESNGLGLDFTDDAFLSSTGHYGSAMVKDTGTPANGYDSHPYGLLTYSSPSLKLCVGPEGTLRYGAHNLILQSENLNVSWTTRDSASATTRSVTFSASGNSRVYQENTLLTPGTYIFSVRFSSGDVGKKVRLAVWTATINGLTSNSGDMVIPAGGVVSYSRTLTDTSSFIGIINSTDATVQTLTLADSFGVHVRRTPSDDTYLKTTSAARYELPYEWDSALDGEGNRPLLGVKKPEAQATNLCLWSDDLTNAAWTKTNCSAAKTATGPDGVANSASTVTATAANGYVQQNITSASAQRISSLYVKRRTGTGAIGLSQGETTVDEIVTNGSFDADSDWAKGTGWSIGSGVATHVGTTAANLAQACLTAGQVYQVTWTQSNGQFVAVYGGDAGTLLSNTADDGEHSVCFVAQGSDLIFRANSDGATIDNVSIFEVVETELSVTDEWTRVNTDAATIENPSLILRLETSGDEIDVALVQNEPGDTVTSPIETADSTVTRAADVFGPPLAAFPWNGGLGIYEVDGVSETPTDNGTILTLAARSGQTHIRTVKWVPSP